MQDEQQDILYRAAEVWKELTEYHYVFTYGYKGELHKIKLTFSPEDFPHLAGFHYLKDIALPRYSPRKTVDMILSGKITYDKVKKGIKEKNLLHIFPPLGLEPSDFPEELLTTCDSYGSERGEIVHKTRTKQILQPAEVNQSAENILKQVEKLDALLEKYL